MSMLQFRQKYDFAAQILKKKYVISPLWSFFFPVADFFIFPIQKNSLLWTN